MSARRSNRWEMVYASPLPAELHDTTFITELGLDYISRPNRNRPFFCHVSYVDRHDPYDPPEPYASIFDPADMPEPLPRDWSGPELPTLKQSTVWKNFESVRDDLDTMRELSAPFPGSLRYLDDQITRLVETLKTLDRPTVVVFATDHGEMLGNHGLITKGVMHYDGGIRCPLASLLARLLSNLLRSGGSRGGRAATARGVLLCRGQGKVSAWRNRRS